MNRSATSMAGWVVVLALAGLAVASAAARASTASYTDAPDVYSSSYVVYHADPGEANDVIFAGPDQSQAPTLIRDAGATIRAGAGCTSLLSTLVQCPWSEADRIALGDRDDRLLVLAGGESAGDQDPVAFDVRGGPGNDTLDGRADINRIGERLAGDDGNDVLRGGSHADALDGGPGDDRLDPGGGCDRGISGGDGNDYLNLADGTSDGTCEASIISCGAGTDTVDADASDVVDSDCEVVRRK